MIEPIPRITLLAVFEDVVAMVFLILK